MIFQILTDGMRRTKNIVFVREYDCDYEQKCDQNVEEEVPDEAGDPVDKWRDAGHELEVFALA